MWLKKHRGKISLVLLTAFISLFVIGCGGQAGTGNNKDNTKKEPVRVLYVEWACATATSYVIADIVENELGYPVELTPVSAAVMYEGLANGDGDGLFCCWLPLTHKDYMEKLGARLDNLGPNLNGAKLALVVPDYVDIDSIEEMNDVKDKFKGEIIGIDPGAGIMRCADQAIKDYNLNYQLIEGSDATMVAALKSAIDKQEWVVVTGWIPHWKFARWDLKTLEDPKKSFGEEETINTIVRQGLKEDRPDVYALFDNFAWTSDDLSRAMILAEENGGDSKKAARQWVEENQDLVKTWLPTTK
ncbi:MAG: glycine betaine ABC transporter substrate-binding protein [Syntrophomonadaceae bacterium]|nr:glycine betaine ABC transporter substrate-binding protein [Syntrophomonadaceae bacterium]